MAIAGGTSLEDLQPFMAQTASDLVNVWCGRWFNNNHSGDGTIEKD